MMRRLRRTWRQVPEWLRAVVAGSALVAVGCQVAHAFSVATPPFVILLGALVGTSYGLLAVCLVLVFRTSLVVNFAQPMTGFAAVAVLPFLTALLGLPYWVAFVLTVALGFALGAAVDLSVIRRFAAAPRVVVVVATIGVAALLSSATDFLQTRSFALDGSPTPPGLFEFEIGPLLVTKDYTGLIIAAPLLVVALTLFMTRSRYGLAIRASASNPWSASLSGIAPRAMTALAWGIAGTCATTLSVFFPSDMSFTSLLQRSGIMEALAAAAIAGMTSYSRALVAGMTLGILEEVMRWSDRYADDTSLVLFAVTITAVLLLRSVGIGDAPGAWTAVSTSRPLPAALARLWSVRALPIVVTTLVIGLVTWHATRSDANAILWTTIVILAVVALSAGLIVSLGGDLSLGQFAIAAIGGIAAYVFTDHTGNPIGGIAVAALAGGIVCAGLAYPCVRVGGLSLTVVTASFAVMISDAVLRGDGIFSGRPLGQPTFGDVALTPGRPYFWWVLGVAAACLLFARNVWTGGFGRLAIATRDNEHAARSFSIRATRVRLQLFFFAGAIAGVAGALLAGAGGALDAATFPADNGVLVVLAVVLGGVGVLGGGPLGSLWVFALPLLTIGQSDVTASKAAIYTGALILLLACPGGAAELLLPVRDLAAIGLGRLHGVRVTMRQLRGESAGVAAEPPPVTETAAAAGVAGTGAPAALPCLRHIDRAPPEPDTVVLEARGLAVAFGGLQAVRSADFEVREGELVGLIGPNGAGKTTTFELLTGFIRPDSGSVIYRQQDVTRLAPERRADLGLIRSFQDAALFPTMSVLEVVELSLERQRRTNVALSALGLDGTARARRRVAHEIVDYFGLGRYFSRSIHELSTGTRRIVELACLTSLQPHLLLLDEPSSGIAQRETEALAGLLARMRAEFGMTMLIIEHDVPLIMSLADRIIAMAEGEVVCEGSPAEVRADERVIDSYLGRAALAIQRSDATAVI